MFSALSDQAQPFPYILQGTNYWKEREAQAKGMVTHTGLLKFDVYYYYTHRELRQVFCFEDAVGVVSDEARKAKVRDLAHALKANEDIPGGKMQLH